MSEPALRVFTAAALVSLLGAVALFLGQLAAPRPSPRFPDAPELEALRGALAQAAESCPCGGGAHRPWPAVLQALTHNPLVLEREHGELPGVRREAAWLDRLARGAPRGSRSGEDRRFLLAFVHWYLEALYDDALRGRGAVPAAELRHRPPAWNQAALQEFRGLGPEDLLGLLD